MTAYAEIRGTDVIGIPGQNLNSAELFVLVGIADGTPRAEDRRRAERRPLRGS